MLGHERNISESYTLFIILESRGKIRGPDGFDPGIYTTVISLNSYTFYFTHCILIDPFAKNHMYIVYFYTRVMQH